MTLISYGLMESYHTQSITQYAEVRMLIYLVIYNFILVQRMSFAILVKTLEE